MFLVVTSIFWEPVQWVSKSISRTMIVHMIVSGYPLHWRLVSTGSAVHWIPGKKLGPDGGSSVLFLSPPVFSGTQWVSQPILRTMIGWYRLDYGGWYPLDTWQKGWVPRAGPVLITA